MLLELSGKYLALDPDFSVKESLETVLHSYGLQPSNLIISCNAKIIRSFENINPNAILHAYVPLLGGKGGYGAKLKTEGGKKVRPNDNMFSRDMNGRRIVYATVEKQYTEFCKKKIQEDEKVRKERQMLKVMETTMKEGTSFMKIDKLYHEQMEKTQQNLTNAFKIGKERYFQRLQQEGKPFEETQVKKLEENKIKNQRKENEEVQLIVNCIEKSQEAKINEKQNSDLVLKRQAPIEDRLEEFQGELKKKVKKNQEGHIQMKVVEEKSNTVSKFGGLLSAKDKLKNLFKK